MNAIVEPIAEIRGAFRIEPAVHHDERGLFVETYRRVWFPEGREMVQANRAERRSGTVVGLHYHLQQSDYWHVPHGSARVVLHDLRRGSPTDRATWMIDLGAQPQAGHNHTGVYIPPGVAHGFAASSDCTLAYLVDRYYDPADELGLAWNDPEVAAVWGLQDPILSARDRANPLRCDLVDRLRPRWASASKV